METEKRGWKKPFFISLAIVLALLAIALVLLLFQSSAEPVTGRWVGSYAMSSKDDIVPIMTDTYVKIKPNGSLALHLDEDTQFTGTWEHSLLSEELYTVSLDNGGTAVMIYSAENDRLSIMIDGIMIYFQH